MMLLSKFNINRTLKRTFPSAKDITVLENPNKRHVMIRVELPWWRRLAFGLSDWNTRRKVEKILCKYGNANVAYAIKVN